MLRAVVCFTVRLVWAISPTQHPVRRAFRLAGLTPDAI
jgi:hypothetical protein